MTASAFSSLSLDPTLVLVCIDRSTETLAAIQASGRFNVNILSAEQEHLSRTFAAKETPQAHGLTVVDHRIGASGVPLINGSLAYFECRVVEQYGGGDHVIFVGEVESAGLGGSEDPLTYFRGKYRRLAPLPA
jgi:flavin reductase (DIM6/NTAB) family NADH-FMN oxidoreductase RutF